MHLGVRGAVEVGALIALSWFGARRGGNASIALAIALPVVAAAFWGVFVAPRSVVAMRPRVKEGLALLVFLLAAVALAGAGEPLLAVAYAGVAVLNSIQLQIARTRG